MTLPDSARKGLPIGIALAVAGYVALRKMDDTREVLSQGDILHGDDRLETGADGEATLGFVDGTSLELAPNAQAVLDAEVFEPEILREMHSHEVVLQSMQKAVLDGADPADVLQAAGQAYAAALGAQGGPEADIPSPSSLYSEDVATQPVGGDIETHSPPEMLMPSISISDLRILEPEPGRDEEEPGGEHEEDSGHTTGHESKEGTSEQGAEHDDQGAEHDDQGADSGHDDGHDSDHESGGESGGYNAGHGGGFGYAGGSLSSVAIFTVTLSSPAQRDVWVDFRTVDGTAISGGQGVDEADYGQTSGTLLIPAGQDHGTIEVTILGDKLVETDEQFFVTLSNPVGAVIADELAIGTIIDSGHGHGSTGEGETLIGTDADDVLITKGGADTLEGLLGNDTLIAGGGPDFVDGGPGDDLIVGLGGPDTLIGGPGDDEIIGHGGADVIDAGPGDDIVYAGGAPDIVSGGEGDDFINAEGGPDIVDGGAGDDVIYGGGGPDQLSGGEGDDVIRGEGGPDILLGGPGDDMIYGGGGPDQLSGGEGSDVLVGGGAGDIFRFDVLDGSVDRILDFGEQDQIDISAILDIDEGDPVSDYVRFSASAEEESSFELSVNPGGTGNLDDFQLVAILESPHSEPDLEQMLVDGNLVVIP